MASLTSSEVSCAVEAQPDVPRHVAIIMDGNGRWADARGMTRTQGHRAGVEAVRRCVRIAMERAIPYLTIYSFSSENWSRPKNEISDLMGLMKRFIRLDLAELHKNNIKIKVIGERHPVEPDMLALIDEAQDLTANNDALTLVIAFNYGARSEIVRAARDVAEAVAAGRMSPEDVDEQSLTNHLDTAGIPDPDLLIRTSGELRLSNFLLWQSAYAELVFLDVLWPDFGAEHMDEALAQFRARDRRYGGLSKKSAI